MEMSAMQLIMGIHSIVKWMMPKKSIMEMCVMLPIQVKPWLECLYQNTCKFNRICWINLYIIYCVFSVTTERTEEKWSRDCNFLEPNTTSGLGCDQHRIDSNGHEVTVDICFCGSSLCNKEMGPMPETTSSSTPITTTTTAKGNIFATVSRHRIEIYNFETSPF